MAQKKVPNTITKELYKQNLQLYNVNRTLEVLTQLYHITSTNLNLDKIASEIIHTITKELEYASGFVAIKSQKHNYLKIVASTPGSISNFIEQQTKQPLTKIHLPLSQKNNLFVKAYRSKSKIASTEGYKLWTSLVPPEEFEKSFSSDKRYSVLVYPLRFGSQPLGSFAVCTNRDISNLSDFEKDVLPRVATVFSLALDRAGLYQGLKKANSELRHLDKLKDDFVYLATHELKTPVTVMKGYLSMIQEGSYGQYPDKINEPLTEIKNANDQLVGLVNNLLEIARSEAQTIKIKTQPTDICQIVEETINSLKPLSEQKKITISYSCPRKPHTVKADPGRLKEVTNNLISNAIKYSDQGTVNIEHIVESDQVITHIADQGVGVSEEDQKKLFTRFFRAQQQAEKVPGTGLGLFIVKQLVEKMGGKIWFTSKLGKGTTFSFSLPLAKKDK